VDDATATTAVYLIISAMRQFARAEVACRKLEWKNDLPLARDPEQKTLGIVGLGGIGTVTARRLALGWGMKVIYHNRRPLAQPPKDFSAEYKENLDDLLREADIVSLHLPVSVPIRLRVSSYQMSPATKNLIGRHQLSIMKEGSVLVNTAR
jgi:lactate dehydrogenase-like 2-hydroxyacid dehydrogenase